VSFRIIATGAGVALDLVRHIDPWVAERWTMTTQVW
jgi:hypothetical protein